MSRTQHWDQIYATKGDAEVSWTEADPHRSLSLIRQVCLPPARVIDVGGGTSMLCNRLLDAGSYSVAVLDVSANALGRARARLGERAADVRWIVADVTAGPDVGTYDCWHDRAVFHFLTDSSDRAAYAVLLRRAVPVGGYAVIATFAPDGPEQCSGLPVQGYDGAALAAELGPGLRLLQSDPETHVTPWGKPQRFTYALLARVADR